MAMNKSSAVLVLNKTSRRVAHAIRAPDRNMDKANYEAVDNITYNDIDNAVNGIANRIFVATYAATRIALDETKSR